MGLAFVIGEVFPYEAALSAGPARKARGGLCFRTELDARRWLVARGWESGKGNPMTVYQVLLPCDFSDCVDGGRLKTAVPLMRVEGRTQRQQFLDDPAVVREAKRFAGRHGKAFEVGRRAAVHVISNMRPATAADLARILANTAALPIPDFDLRELDR